jgi:hypothetical protein
MKHIAIHGVPRSGTTWLGALFDSCPAVRYANQPLFSYAFKGRLTLSSTTDDVLQFFGELSTSSDEFINQTFQKQKGTIPSFKKGEVDAICYKEARYHHLIPHLLQIDPELVVVLIIRNPLSVLASWVKAPKEFDPGTMDVLEEWRKAEKKNGHRAEEWYGFDKWKEFANMAPELTQLYPERCHIINYNDLLSDTDGTIKACFAFCGIPYGPQTAAFIDASRSTDMTNDAYSVFRVKQDDRKGIASLPPAIIHAVEQELQDTPLSLYLQ